jgi:SAM-dependent methyltransferase
MKRYSKPLGRLLDYKQDFFHANDSKLAEFRNIAASYRSQPRRTACKNCAQAMSFSPEEGFDKLGVKYAFCPRCGHCNGAHEDTDAFCRALYTDNQGQGYARNYSPADLRQYQGRVAEIYLPKARFLKESLAAEAVSAPRLADFGAGAGHFVAAAQECGFSRVIGYEPSETLVRIGNAMMGSARLIRHDLSGIVPLIAECDAQVVSFIGVLEHLQAPRAALQALSRNERIEYVFFSVPLFSPTVVIESVFPEIMPRHLVAGHTHLYTEQSIQFFCGEFGFQRVSEWWFGLDMADLSRSVLVSLQKVGARSAPLQAYWTERFMPLIDKLQGVLDEAQVCSEVHMLLRKEALRPGSAPPSRKRGEQAC